MALFAYMVLTVYQEYFHPRFMTLPMTYHFKSTTGAIYPQLGNTLAMTMRSYSQGVDTLKEQVRFQFKTWDRKSDTNTTIDAVYCQDLYAEELEAERNGTWTTSYFTDAFLSD